MKSAIKEEMDQSFDRSEKTVLENIQKRPIFHDQISSFAL
ncbi:hypothetical protein EV677_2706 [Herminiimonas fonticola]|uniref:Uncharacterized protein n=1 Tax=Herminiimonas fonticola TaxID=303380 RepID=A0A4R6G1K5_9BURK|nr:hypothetical protein Hfont_2337 [Herminiimonas fonticola]TDN88219.1 hypothetical protein EV677_2706 [Herminiimonas fonticola]